MTGFDCIQGCVREAFHTRETETRTHLFDHPAVVPRVEFVRVPASQLLQNHSPVFLGFLGSLQTCGGGGRRLLPLVQQFLLTLLVPLLTASGMRTLVQQLLVAIVV